MRQFIISLICLLLIYAGKAQKLTDSLFESGKEEYRQGNAALALEKFTRALENCISLNDLACQAESHRMLGETYRASSDFALALQHLHDARRLATMVGDNMLYAKILNRFGAVFYETGQLDSALLYTNRSLNLTRLLDDPEFNANNLNLLGAIANNQGDPKAAIGYYQDALRFQKDLPNKVDIPNVLNNLANAYIQQGDLDQAIRYAKESLELAQRSGTKTYIHWAASILTRAYEAKAEYQNAFTYLILVNTYQDSLFNERKAQQIAEINARYERDRTDRENEILKKDKTLAERENFILYIVTIFIIILLIGLSVGLFLMQKSRRRKDEANRLLTDKNREIEEKSRHIESQKKRLEELNQTKDRLFSIISHDLRSPLNSLHGILTLIRSGALSEAELKTLTSSLIERMDHTTILLDNLLNWSRSQLKGFKMNPERASLRELALENIQLLSPQAEQKQINISHELKGDLPGFIDRDMVRLIFRNLLSNAIKFTPQGGEIKVFGETAGGESWVIVKDSGVGMNAEEQQNLFGAHHFSRYGTNNERGSGLGLLLVKEFVEKNFGQIVLQSELGKGSEFKVSFQMNGDPLS